MENSFDCLCSLLSKPEYKAAFLKEEGVELMILIMK
jgi:beta-catenin-like protein 1